MPLHRSGLVSRHALAHPEEPQAEPLPYERVLKYNPNHGPDGRFTSGGGGRRGGTAGPPTEDAFGRPMGKGGKISHYANPKASDAMDDAMAGGPRAGKGPPSKSALRATRERWNRGKPPGDAAHEAAIRHGYDSPEAVGAAMKEHARRAGGGGGTTGGYHEGQFKSKPAVAPYTITDTSNDTKFSIGGPRVIDPNFHIGDEPRPDPHFNRELPKTPHGMRAATIPPAITGGLSNRAYREEEARQVAELKARGVLDASGRPAEHPRSSSGKFHVENPAGPNFQFSNEQRRQHAKEMFGSVGERAEKYKQTGKLPVKTPSKTAWVLEMGKAAYAANPGNYPPAKREQDKTIRSKAKALAKQTTSWDDAIQKANEAESENYHEVAEIFRNRADQLNPNLKPKTRSRR